MYIIKMTDILSMPVISLECQWAVTHAARGRDGRQEGLSAATTTFTAISMKRFFIRYSV